ncbi:MAG: LemA family protein [Candidatus Pacebacteria bacterium]|nr:LemA family protein [Candidatus Paceibacterota bacterium]
MESIYIVSSIILLMLLFIFLNFLFFLMVKSQTKRAFKEVDDYLRRKIELATQIMAEISRYVSYEKDFLKNIVEAKKQAERAETVEEKKKAGNLLSAVFNAAFSAAEKHPELKVSERLKKLKQEFKDIEEGVDSLKDLLSQITGAVKKLLKTKPFGVIYDLFKKEEKIVKEEVKKVKKRIIKKKK